MKDKRRGSGPGNPDQTVRVTGIRVEPDGTVRLRLERPLGNRAPFAPPEGLPEPGVIEPTAVYRPRGSNTKYSAKANEGFAWDEWMR